METLKGIFTPFTRLSQRNIIVTVSAEILLLLTIWSLGHYTFFPKPIEVARAIFHLGKDGLLPEVLTSFWICMKAMFFATLASCIISYASTIPVFKYISLLITKFRFLSMVGLEFFFIMSFSGDGLKVALLTFSVTVFFTTSFISAINDIEEYEFFHAMTTGLNKWQTLKEIVIYGKIADMLEFLKQNFAMAWMMITMVEGLVRSGGGIGVLLLNQQRTLSLDYIMALQIIILIIGIAMDYSIGYIKYAFCPWSKKS